MKETDIQASVLGTLIINPSLFIDVSELVQPFMFSESYLKVAEAIWFFKQKGGSYSFQMIVEQSGDQKLCTELANQADWHNLQSHARIVNQNYLKNQLLTMHQKAQQGLSNGILPEEVQLSFQSQKDLLYSLVMPSDENINSVQEAVEIMLNAKKGLVGLDTGFPSLNKKTGGWRPGKFVVMAARPGMGKTTIALQDLLLQAESGKKAAFFSLEMSISELMLELALMKTSILKINMLEGKLSELDEQAIIEALDYIHGLSITFLDQQTCKPKIELLVDKVRRIAEEGLDIVYIDYLQLLKSIQKTQSRNYELGEIAMKLKEIAQELEIPIIALAQLSRAVETRGGAKRPIMSDIRDSGEIEQAADLISFIYRPEKYDILEDEEGRSLKGILEYITVKNRFLGTLGEGVTYRYWNGSKYIEISKSDIGDQENILMKSPIIEAQKVDIKDDIPF